MTPGRGEAHRPVGLDPRRAAEVIAARPGDPDGRGSGYLITGQFVLTAAHVLTAAESIRVRFNADQAGQWSASAEVAWSDPGLDVALLRIMGESVAPPGAVPEVIPVSFGRVTRPPANCEAVGFPLFKLREDRTRTDAAGRTSQYRDYHHAVGTATSWSNLREGTMAVDVRAPERDPRPERSPWEGMSGAAIFSGDYLIGVIGEHHRSDGLGTLAAYRIDHWYEYLSASQVIELSTLIGLPGTASGLAEIAAAARPGTAGPLHQLPATTRVFTGRERELGELLELAVAVPEQSSPGMVVISAIDGMAGIGKTALAVHAAHLCKDRFPDGQLFIDLHGYTQGIAPREPTDALAVFLKAFGISPQQIPSDLDARAALFRDRLSGTRTLILLDNAATEAQVRPLVPGDSGCLVIVTSRRRLKGLDDVNALSLDVLPALDAVALFRQVAGPERISADHPLLEEIAEMCGHLPLALRIAAALIRNSKTWNLGRLTGRLREQQPGQQLEGFSDGDRKLAAVFDLSYASLDGDLQLLFRRLGLVPGPDIDAYAAAALLDGELADTEHLLQALVDHNLLTEPQQGRYRMHDLIRAHARSRADRDDPATDCENALDQLLDYYQHTAQVADSHLAYLTPAYLPPIASPPHHVPALGTREQADTWVGSELANLNAAAQHSATRAWPVHAIALPAALHAYLRTHGPWTRALALHAAAADIARAMGDGQGQGTALNNLGAMRREVGDYLGAVQALQEALDLFRAFGNRQGQGAVLSNLSLVWWAAADYPGAAQAAQQALDLYQGLGDRPGEAAALNNLGIVRRAAGDYPGAALALQAALRLFRALGNRQREAIALNNLGVVWREIGDYLNSVQALEQALDLFQVLGDRQGQANALGNLGITRREIGDYTGAAQAVQQVLEEFREIGYRSGEAEALNEYGKILTATGELKKGREHHGQALLLAREIDSPSNEAAALEGLGEVSLREGSYADGVENLRQALEIYQRLGVPGAQRVKARLAELGR